MSKKLLKELNDRVKVGSIRVQRHPRLPLSIYNYTRKCQYEKLWDEYTMMARGLILEDETGKIVGHPFGKFFNLGEGELGKITTEKFDVFDKADGYLFIVCGYNGERVFASRGSFTSDYAIRGQKVYEKSIGKEFCHKNGETHLFELFYADRIIVVNYGNHDKLIYLDGILNKTGKSMHSKDWSKMCYTANMIEPVKYFGKITDPSTLPERENAEGFVLICEDGHRVKIKYDEYVRLHWIMTDLTEKRIWESLRDGKPITEALDNVPDEFYEKVRGMENRFKSRFDNIVNEAHLIYKTAINRHSEAIERFRYIENHSRIKIVQTVSLAMMNNTKYDRPLWQFLKPKILPPSS